MSGCRLFPSEEASEEAAAELGEVVGDLAVSVRVEEVADEIHGPRRLLLGGFALTTEQIGQATDVETLPVQVSISFYLWRRPRPRP